MKVTSKKKKVKEPTKFKDRRKQIKKFVPQSQTIVQFVENDPAPEVGDVAGNHVFSAGDQTLDTDIAEFFARPVRIQSFTWNETDAIGATINSINPWNLWASNAYVKNKLNNYAWFRGDLHLKVQVSASPFYFGLLKMCYQPLQNLTPTTIVKDTGTRYLIPYSQRPHIDIDVGQNDSYDFKVPFIYHMNWVNVQSAAKMTDLGLLESLVYAQLDSANGVTGTGIGITIYAWIDDIQLSGASVGYSMQSDEFGEGCVSKPASWVASAASYLEDIPVIGTFATATRIGASAISSIASLFGFTNVPVIADTQPFRSEPFPKFSSSDIGFPIERLSLDPKNELSVDPRIIGLPTGEDEMSIQGFTTRESWLTRASWSTTNIIDDTLFWCNVNPTMFDNDNATQAKLYMTPMAYMAKAFRDWRGSIIFRFHVVTSKYHRGKLRVSFDPSGYAAQNIGNTTTSANVVYTAIIDIGETRDVEFTVPYQQALQFLAVNSNFSNSQQKWAVNSTMSTFVYNSDFDNGSLTVRVLTPLTSPNSSSTVSLEVYVRAGSDIEFANPTPVDTSSQISFFAPQSAELTEMATPDGYDLAKTRGDIDNQYLVHYGENIRSLRQLLRRYEISQVEAITPTVAGTTHGYFQKGFYKMPIQPGYTGNAYSTANKIVGVGTANYGFSNMTNVCWFSNCYLAYRGSMNWSFDVSSTQDIHHLRVYKDNRTQGSVNFFQSTTAYTNDNQLEAMVRNFPNSGSSGSAATDQRTQAGINICAPHYSRFKFCSTNPLNSYLGALADGSTYDRFALQGAFITPTSKMTDPVVITTYTGIGVDFGLYYFVNTPTVYVYSSAPTPN